MRLTIDESWAVDCDDTCCTLIRMLPIQPGPRTKPENVGKIREIQAGFYGNIRQALRGYLEKSVQTIDQTLDVRALIAAIEKAEATIEAVHA